VEPDTTFEAVLHDTELTPAAPSMFSDAVPGTSCAAPQTPATSFTTKAWPCADPST